MSLALDEAQKAASCGETPVGAVIVDARGDILARAHNIPIQANDPTAHAELLAMRQAGAALANYRLTGCVLAVTLEPCLMCTGAMVHARLDGVVFGASDPRTGAVASQLQGFDLPFHNHRPWVLSGVLSNACGELLRDFFRARRKKQM